MNFFINQAMGMGNSGVEHAQFYRAKRFDQAHLPYRLVFVELIPNLHEAMTKWNLQDDQVINMWEYLVLGSDYAINGLGQRSEATDDLIVDDTNTHRLRVVTTVSGMKILTYYVKYPNPKKAGTLLVSPARIEIYDADSGDLKVMYSVEQNRFHKDEIRNIHLYNQAGGQHLFFNNLVRLKRYFYEQLDRLYDGHSVFVIDRGEQNEVALLTDKLPDSKIVDVIHADHLSDRNVASDPLWNNYYEYVLNHADLVDRFVVATELQRQDLLVDFPEGAQKFVTIPVGGVSDKVAKFDAHDLPATIKLVTVSRLAAEKHIDLIIKAVIKFHDEDQKVSLDVYGAGGEKDKLQKLIDDAKAGDYITLKGHTQHADQIYPQYDAFVSASFSEGFGLTYIEALNAALPVVTFKARFGALELIHDEQNGFLQNFERDNEEFNVDQLVNGLYRLKGSDYQTLRQQVVSSVDQFRDQVIADKWRELLDEL